MKSLTYYSQHGRNSGASFWPYIRTHLQGITVGKNNRLFGQGEFPFVSRSVCFHMFSRRFFLYHHVYIFSFGHTGLRSGWCFIFNRQNFEPCSTPQCLSYIQYGNRIFFTIQCECNFVFFQQ